MQLETEGKLKMYRESVGRVNGMAEPKFAEYYGLVEQMLQLDENRIEFVKGLIRKHIALTEQVAQIYVGKMLSVMDVVEHVSGENDLTLFVTEMQKGADPESAEKLNPLFVPLGCTEHRNAYCIPPIGIGSRCSRNRRRRQSFRVQSSMRKQKKCR